MATPKYTFHASLAGLNVSKAAYLAANPHIVRLMAAAMVFRLDPATSAPQVLLLRRAASDSYPLRWEIPGGSVDASDATVLDGVARELWEETGLVAAHMVAPILLSPPEEEEGLTEEIRAGLGIQPRDEQLGVNRDGLSVTFMETGNVWAKPAVLVTARSTETAVVLRDEEHAEAAWVTEEDVRRGELRGEDGTKRRMDFVSDGVRRSILDGFRVYAASISK
ncbi:hypothetical protein PWT90_03541 [Aphanocladium album]|nr:hypothetical protein PWT90_03541 [Aphanocladium album]